MPTPVAGKIIMDGILENRRIFSVPNHFMLPVAFVRYAIKNSNKFQYGRILI